MTNQSLLWKLRRLKRSLTSILVLISEREIPQKGGILSRAKFLHEKFCICLSDQTSTKLKPGFRITEHGRFSKKQFKHAWSEVNPLQCTYSYSMLCGKVINDWKCTWKTNRAFTAVLSTKATHGNNLNTNKNRMDMFTSCNTVQHATKNAEEHTASLCHNRGELFRHWCSAKARHKTIYNVRFSL